MHRRSDQHRVGFSLRLHPRGDIGGVTEDVGLLAGARTNHYRTGIDTDPRGQLWARRSLVELGYGAEDREPRARSSLRIVIVRLGIAKEGHNTVAEILGDMTIKTSDRVSG